MARPPYFPAFLDLYGRACVVVGAGHIARDKIAGLLEAGAHVTVIAPQAESEVEALARTGALCWQQRPYREGDLQGAFLVIAATAEPGVNRQVQTEARAGGQLVNVVDVPELCDYITPSVVRRGRLTIAISTQGTAPALAAVLRRFLERLLGDEVGEFLERAALWRGQLNRARLTPAEKRRWWHGLLGRAAPLLLNASPRRGPPRLPAEHADLMGEHPATERMSAARPAGAVGDLGLLSVDPAGGSPETRAALRDRLADGDALAAALAAARSADGRRVFDGFLILAGEACPGLVYHSAFPRLAGRAARAALDLGSAEGHAMLVRRGEAALQALFDLAARAAGLSGTAHDVRGELRAGLDAAGLRGTLSPLLEAAALSALAYGHRQAGQCRVPRDDPSGSPPGAAVRADDPSQADAAAATINAVRRFAQAWRAHHG